MENYSLPPPNPPIMLKAPRSKPSLIKIDPVFQLNFPPLSLQISRKIIKEKPFKRKLQFPSTPFNVGIFLPFFLAISGEVEKKNLQTY
jgi:hypothetical protein